MVLQFSARESREDANTACQEMVKNKGKMGKVYISATCSGKTARSSDGVYKSSWLLHFTENAQINIVAEIYSGKNIVYC